MESADPREMVSASAGWCGSFDNEYWLVLVDTTDGLGTWSAVVAWERMPGFGGTGGSTILSVGMSRPLLVGKPCANWDCSSVTWTLIMPIGVTPLGSICVSATAFTSADWGSLLGKVYRVAQMAAINEVGMWVENDMLDCGGMRDGDMSSFCKSASLGRRLAGDQSCDVSCWVGGFVMNVVGWNEGSLGSGSTSVRDRWRWQLLCWQ